MNKPPYPIVEESTPLFALKPARVSTGEVLLRVMQEDNRSVQHLLDGGKEKKGGSAFGTTAFIAFLAVGPVLSAVYRTVMRFKEDADEEMINLNDEVKEFEEGGHDEKALDDDDAKYGVKKSLEGLVGKDKAKTMEQAATQSVSPSVIRNTPSEPGTSYTGKLARPTEEVDTALKRVAARSGSDYATLYAFAGSESSFRTKAKASTSSATGILQFTSGTWKYLIEGPFKHLGYGPGDRTDTEKAATVAAMYIERIRGTLKKALGYEPSIGEIYTGYVMGPTGGARFLRAMRANANQIGALLFPAAAKANKSLFYQNGKSLTLEQTFGKMSGKVNSYHAVAQNSVKNIGSSVASSGGKPPSDESNLAPKVSASPQKSVPVAAKVATATKASPVKLSISETTSKAEEVSENEYEDDYSTQGEQKAESPTGRTPHQPQAQYVKDRHGRLLSIPG